MADIEKVIKGLECCQMVYECKPYEKCPYSNGLECGECDINRLHYDALELLKKQQMKTYGKVYCVSAETVVNDKNKVERELAEDIVKCLVKNGVLFIHSEETIPGVQVTYGWKLKGLKVDWNGL